MDLYYILAAICTTGNQIEAKQASLNKFPIAITTVTAAFIIVICWQVFVQGQICIARKKKGKLLHEQTLFYSSSMSSIFWYFGRSIQQHLGMIT
jgi:hypothetical protein